MLLNSRGPILLKIDTKPAGHDPEVVGDEDLGTLPSPVPKLLARSEVGW